MLKLTVALALFASVAANPGVVSPLAYHTNAPLYAAGGSQQIDVRNNYDGTLSSYATEPFNYAAAPFSNRYVSGYSAPLPAHLATYQPFAKYSAGLPFAPAAPYAPAPYAASYAAGPLAAPISNAYAAAPAAYATSVPAAYF